jgi:hypothetical protein
MAGKQKLELTWIGEENRPRLVRVQEPCTPVHSVIVPPTSLQGHTGVVPAD